MDFWETWPKEELWLPMDTDISWTRWQLYAVFEDLNYGLKWDLGYFSG